MVSEDHGGDRNSIVTRVEDAAERGRSQTAKDLRDDVLSTIELSNPTALSAQVAYSLVFALPSILLAVMAIAVQLDGHSGFQMTALIRQVVTDHAPEQLRPLLDSLIEGAIERAHQIVPTISALVTAVIALVIAGGGFQSMAYACARAGGVVDMRPYWLRRLMGSLSILLVAVLLVVGFLLFTFGEAISRFLSDATVGSETGATIWKLLQQPFALVLVFLALLLMYRYGAGMRLGWRWFVPGAAGATLAIVVLLKVFQIYLRVSNPGSAYGAASSVLLLLVFFYLMSLVLIGGAMVSAVLGRRYDKRAA